MSPDIACQMIGKTTAASVWSAVHSMFGAQSRANVRHIRRQIQSLKKLDLSAAKYMNKIKALADTMYTAGAPLSDDEIVDYMLAGLGSDFNPLAASMLRDNAEVSLSDFYSHVLNYESMICAQQADGGQTGDWTSLANSVSRPGHFSSNGQPRPFNGNVARQGEADARTLATHSTGRTMVAVTVVITGRTTATARAVMTTPAITSATAATAAVVEIVSAHAVRFVATGDTRPVTVATGSILSFRP